MKTYPGRREHCCEQSDTSARAPGLVFSVLTKPWNEEFPHVAPILRARARKPRECSFVCTARRASAGPEWSTTNVKAELQLSVQLSYEDQERNVVYQERVVLTGEQLCECGRWK